MRAQNVRIDPFALSAAGPKFPFDQLSCFRQSHENRFGYRSAQSIPGGKIA